MAGTVIDDESLINEVLEQPVIWNTRIKAHKDLRAVQNAWEAIAENLEIGVDDASYRWQNLRRNYIRYKNAERRVRSGDQAATIKSYIYAQQMSFLDAVIKYRATLNNVQTETTTTNSLEPEMEAVSFNYAQTNSNTTEPFIIYTAQSSPELIPAPSSRSIDTPPSFTQHAASSQSIHTPPFTQHSASLQSIHTPPFTQRSAPSTSTHILPSSSQSTRTQHTPKNPKNSKRKVQTSISPPDTDSRILNMIEENTKMLRESEDSNWHFLKSLLPKLRAMPEEENYRMRIRMMQLLYGIEK